MNKKSIIAIAILAIVLVAGIYYTIQDKEDDNDLGTDDAVIDQNENEQQEVPDEEEEEQSQAAPETQEEGEDTEGVVLEKGKPAPDFTLTTLTGEKASLSDYKGKVVMINFWATWCTYCDKEMPDLQKIYEENKDKDFVVLAVNVGEDKKTAKDYIDKGGYSFPVLLDEDNTVAQTKYFVSAFPTTYYIGKDGNLIGAVQGMMTYPQMNQVLEQIRNGEL